jgi:large subunit ribosomal protein L21
MDAYAVIETGGKQYRVQKGDVLAVEKLTGNVGDKITLSRVLALSNGSDLTIGTPEVAGASVTAEVVKHFRGEKVTAFRKKRRKGYKKKRGHRQSQTQLKIESIGA